MLHMKRFINEVDIYFFCAILGYLSVLFHQVFVFLYLSACICVCLLYIRGRRRKKASIQWQISRRILLEMLYGWILTDLKYMIFLLSIFIRYIFFLFLLLFRIYFLLTDILYATIQVSEVSSSFFLSFFFDMYFDPILSFIPFLLYLYKNLLRIRSNSNNYLVYMILKIN